jgi:tRNA threonylcarbamoyladenosine biosynthesis protein TsaB
LAHAAFEQQPYLEQIVALLDARMGEVYAGVFRRQDFSVVETLSPLLCRYDDVNQQLAQYCGAKNGLVGLGVRQVPADFANTFGVVDENANPSAQALLALAQIAWRNGPVNSVEQAELVYLRNSVTWDKHQLRRNRTL